MRLHSRENPKLNPQLAQRIAEDCYGEVLAYCRRHAPEGFEPLLLVSTTKFKTHRTADGEGLVVDRRRGRVYRVMADGASPRRFVAAGSFAEACSLARLLSDSGVFPLS